jgi:hypothetical protein
MCDELCLRFFKGPWELKNHITFYLIFMFKESLNLIKDVLAYILTQEYVWRLQKPRAK